MPDPFDALSANVSTPVRMTIISPVSRTPLTDEAGNVAYLELLSDDSEKGQQLDRDVAKGILERRRRSSESDIAKFDADKVIALLTGWYLVGLDGKPIEGYPFNAENARRMMYADKMKWLRDQALAFVVDAGNFMPSSSQS